MSNAADYRPLIGLTVGRDLPDRPEFLHLRRSYPRAIEAAGGVPVLLPPVERAESVRRVFEALDGIVFPGGVDVGPDRYGAPSVHPTTHVDAVLDELELSVARLAAQSEKPVLGICRGHQVLNVALGGTLVQDLPTEMPGPVVHRQAGPRDAVSHPIEVDQESRLGTAFGACRFEVNSFHHQGVKDLAPSLKPVAWSPDGLVEGFESTEHPWLLAVQFHPEDLVGFHEPSRRLFAALVDACRERARRRERVATSS